MRQLQLSTRNRLVGLVLGIGMIVALALVVPFAIISLQLADLRAQLDPPDASQLDHVLATQGVVFGIGTALAAGAGLVAALLLRRWFTAPLKGLADIAARVAVGEDVPFRAPDSPDAAALASALESMRGRLRTVQKQTARQAVEAGVVNRFTDAVSFADDDEHVVRALDAALREVAAPDSAVVRLEVPGKDRPVAIGGAEREAAEPSRQGARPCAGVRRGGVHLVEDPSDPLSIACPAAPGGPGATACVPLTALGNLVGTVHLGWDATGRPASWDPARIERLAAHAALAIANRRLLVELHGMASTDPRTGLANSRTFDDAVERALTAGTGDEPNAVVMLDLDHFKRFNDRHGHAAGDEALRAFAAVLRGSLREGDVAARYGGEEFAALLRGLDASAAVQVAERIRERTESLAVAVGTGERASIRVSAGVAVAPMHGSGRESLLRAADSALYAAKAAGRNRVALAWAGESQGAETAAAETAGADAAGAERAGADAAGAETAGADAAAGGDADPLPSAVRRPGHGASQVAVMDPDLRISGRSGTSRRS